MVFALVTKKFRAWRIARNTRGQEFKPPQFSQGHRVGKLRYYTEGDENSQVTLVFVHGYTLAAQAWHVQVAAFADQVRCIAMDLRGHGKSDPVPASECNIPDAADDVMAVLDDAGVTTPIILVGHSLGTMVVLNFLRRYPQFRLRCRGVVLVSASAQPFPSAVTNVVAPVVTAAAALAHEEDMRKLHIKLIDDTPLATIIGFLDDLQEEDETESLAQLSSIPGAVLVGADDIFTPVASSEYIVQHWPAARLTVVPSAGHMLPLENPAAVNTAISAMLAVATP